MTSDPITEDDIAQLVPAFYERVRRDEILGPIFNGAIADWPHHLEKLQAFWSSVMLTSGRYKGQPLIAHVRHAQHMSQANFARWIGLWRQTCEDLLAPEIAAAFLDKASRIAESLQHGVQFYEEKRIA